MNVVSEVGLSAVPDGWLAGFPSDLECLEGLASLLDPLTPPLDQLKLSGPRGGGGGGELTYLHSSYAADFSSCLNEDWLACSTLIPSPDEEQLPTDLLPSLDPPILLPPCNLNPLPTSPDSSLPSSPHSSSSSPPTDPQVAEALFLLSHDPEGLCACCTGIPDSLPLSSPSSSSGHFDSPITSPDIIIPNYQFPSELSEFSSFSALPNCLETSPSSSSSFPTSPQPPSLPCSLPASPPSTTSPLSSSPSSPDYSPSLEELLVRRDSEDDYSNPCPKSVLGKRRATAPAVVRATKVTKGSGKRPKLPKAVKKERKKEQNKQAALRYRQKRREAFDEVEEKREELEVKNSQLKSQVEALSSEIDYLKNLWQEIQERKLKKDQL